jgi:hypothetical protein
VIELLAAETWAKAKSKSIRGGQIGWVRWSVRGDRWVILLFVVAHLWRGKQEIREMTKRIVVMLIAVLTLAGCRGLPFRDPSAEAERKLTAVLQALPTPPGARLLAQRSSYEGGTMAQCAAQQLQALYGTSDSSLTEVLDFYAAALPPAGWRPDAAATEHDRGFRQGEEYSLSMYITNHFGGAMIGRSTQTAAEAQFETIYIVDLMTPFILPYPAECRGG